MLRFLAGAGLLDRVRYVSSVSGGSVANALFASGYEEMEKESFSLAVLDRVAIRPFVTTITTRSFTGSLAANLWRIVGPSTRTDLLAWMFDRWFFGERTLESLSPRCRFVFNAASLTTGVRFAFERDVVGDWVMGHAPTAGTGLRLSQAVAASAAVPGAFAPFVVKGVSFPCADGRAHKLLDGGAYDNSGLEAVDDLPDAVVVSLNAGGLFRTGAYGRIPIVRDLQRSNSLLYRQSTALRRREMVERFRAWEEARDAGEPAPRWARRGVLFGLATRFERPETRPPPDWADRRPEHPEWIEDLATYRTSFSRFPAELARRLLYRGWWLAGATLSRYHPDLLPPSLPEWSDP